MFRLRVVYGANKGKYLKGYDNQKYEAIFTDNIDEAPIHSPEDTASIIMAAMDITLTIVAPEKTNNTSEEDISNLVEHLAQGMFSNYNEATIYWLKKCIREDKDTPILDMPDDMPKKQDNSYIGVFEWRYVVLCSIYEKKKE